jgi:hypothetical protein
VRNPAAAAAPVSFLLPDLISLSRLPAGFLRGVPLQLMSVPSLHEPASNPS